MRKEKKLFFREEKENFLGLDQKAGMLCGRQRVKIEEENFLGSDRKAWNENL